MWHALHLSQHVHTVGTTCTLTAQRLRVCWAAQWTTWARTLILAQLPVYLIWLLAYTAFVLLFQARPPCCQDA